MASRAERPSRVLVYVSALTMVGAAIRFATLDRQSFWLDELVTVSLLRRDFGDVLGQIPDTEATPFLYYVLAWPWARAFGFGEVGLRSLSALVGTAVIPVAYAAGATLVTRRVGLIAAALVSVSPMLIWYSQEARSYGLLSLLGAASVLLFARALRSGRRALAGWAIVSALAVATHYFAAFLIVAEAIWLLYALRSRRAALLASLVPVATLAAHVPVLLEQRGNAEAVAGASLGPRAAGLPKNLAVAYSFPAEAVGTVLVAGLLLLGVVLLAARASPRDQLGAFVAGSLALSAIAIPLVLALLGADYVSARNGIVAVVPAAVFFGAGYVAHRVGVAAAAVLSVLLAAISVAPAVDERYGRTDWRGAAERLSAPNVERVIVTTPFMSPTLWAPYVALAEPEAEGARAREIVVLGLATEGGFSTGAVRPPEGPPRPPPNGFRLLEFERLPTYSLARYEARIPRVVPIEALAGLRLSVDQQPGVLVQSPAR